MSALSLDCFEHCSRCTQPRRPNDLHMGHFHQLWHCSRGRSNSSHPQLDNLETAEAVPERVDLQPVGLRYNGRKTVATAAELVVYEMASYRSRSIADLGRPLRRYKSRLDLRELGNVTSK